MEIHFLSLFPSLKSLLILFSPCISLEYARSCFPYFRLQVFALLSYSILSSVLLQQLLYDVCQVPKYFHNWLNQHWQFLLLFYLSCFSILPPVYKYLSTSIIFVLWFKFLFLLFNLKKSTNWLLCMSLYLMWSVLLRLVCSIFFVLWYYIFPQSNPPQDVDIFVFFSLLYLMTPILDWGDVFLFLFM